jgi:Protein of unknown function (DUF3761)/Glucodextranase, domain B
MDRINVASRVTSSRRSARGIVSCAAVVIVGALCGCGSTSSGTTSAQSAAPATVPKAAAGRVALHLNAGSYSLSSASTTISGTVTRGASVKVNGRVVRVHAGRWTRTLALHLGRNSVTVAATMHGRAHASTSIGVTRERSAAELEARAAASAFRAEARKREAAEVAERKAAKAAPIAAKAAPICTNGTYVNSAGNTVCSPEQSPTAPAGATAQCEDGTYSFSESRSGTCSHHGGVAKWL